MLRVLPDRDEALRRLAPADGTPPLLDLMLSAVYEQSMHWSQRLGWHVIEHDRSDILELWRDQLLALADPKRVRELAITPSAQMRRIKLDDLVPVDSRESPAVQIADVVAGACRAWLNARGGHGERPELLDAIEGAGTLQLIDWWVWPERLLLPQR
ncbi:DUF3800 domain-containing protein [Solirubrobacter phytolaccae]|uniref:DUF3800 domain-containing protein n=1 Tax=Solirubrobacter phytolaccae TaxID=1404360 RepID=A0A9X3N985_9ACTN|nr:DUF3800 domain-containing protein [Solirubrobacter phytolaccae]MDA0179951.1 DUF3800 domain-containing protein [Solirubrobacter phytolaccae]